MSRPILYSFRRCPYAMRARMALHYSRQVCELREVVLKTKPAEMLAVSEKGTVPVLVLNYGKEGSEQVIDESLDVMCWALKQHDPDFWMHDIQDHNSAAEHPVIARNDRVFTEHLTRYKYADRYVEATQLDYFEKCCEFLDVLDKSMVQGDAGFYFIDSGQLSFLDVAIFPFVRQCLAVDAKLSQALQLPRLKAWHDNLIESELFKNSMVKYPMWTAHQNNVVEFGDSA